MNPAVKRLRKEAQLARAERKADEDVILCPDENDLRRWTAYLRGPKDTPFAGGVFKLSIAISASYPMDPPDIRFITKIFHPNVHFKVIIIDFDNNFDTGLQPNLPYMVTDKETERFLLAERLEDLKRFLGLKGFPATSMQDGMICLDILKREWSPAWSLDSACRAVLAMMSDPNADSPLNCDAGNMIRAGDTLAYQSMASMYRHEFALSNSDIPK